MQETNTLAYIEHSQITSVRSFVTLAPELFCLIQNDVVESKTVVQTQEPLKHNS
jgi:hypothetical protein